jgi:Protein of unknown function (DUF1552)
MKLPPISRRNLLIASGLGGASLFLPSLLPRRARAQTAPIKRIVFLIQEHGTVRSSWYMHRNHAADAKWEYPFDNSDPMSFSEILRPLHPNRAKLLVLEGLAQASTAGDVATNNHNAGHLHLMTGAKMIDDFTAGGPSVDQVIANAVAVPGRIPSLEMATTSPWLGGYINSMAGQRVPVVTDPQDVFDRLFPAGFGDMTQAPSERDLIRAARGSVLDLVQNEFSQIAPKLSADDRKKLELHRDQVRDLELRLSSFANIDCDAPVAPPNTRGHIPTAQAFSDLVAAAFACDLTRVATIQVTQLLNEDFGAPAGDMHQDYAHQTDRDADAAKYMTQYNRVHAELFNYLVSALDRYPDGEGTLLDNTVCIWLTELATGPHALDRIPVVMAGSCAGELKVGRYVSYEQNQPNCDPWPDATTPPVGPPHQQLLVSLMNAMDVPDTMLGMTSTQTRSKPIQTVKLTGALDGLA